ncbi:MAG TPA: hypothetical protein VHV82_15800, partial [Sporichthyaceae bacterium]|nr:hypothetical protein [Sporichthyaceae bacterium]
AVGLPSCPAWCGRGDLARYCVDSWDLEGVHVIHGAYHASDTGPGFGTLRTGGGTARVYVSRNDVPDRQGPVEVNLDEDSDLLAYNRMSPEVARQLAVELAAAAEFAARLNAAGVTRA